MVFKLADHPVHVVLSVCDVTGRVAATIFNGEMTPGTFTESIDRLGLKNGVYFVVLQIGTTLRAQKMTVIR